MDQYRDNLSHVVRPEDPVEREDADRIRLNDYEALYLYEAFVEYAAYGGDETKVDIASAYAEYIDNAVRDERKNVVYLYTHTTEAAETIVDAIDERSYHVNNLHHNLAEQADALCSRAAN